MRKCPYCGSDFDDLDGHLVYMITVVKDEEHQTECPKTRDGKHVWRKFGSLYDKNSIKIRCFACGKFANEA